MEDSIKIDLEQEFAKKLGMRSTAEELFKKLEDTVGEVVLDFKGVVFMSRSFAQEYVYQKDVSGVDVVEVNVNDFIVELLSVVENEYAEEDL